MSQFVDYETAKTLKKGDTLYHNIIEFTDKNGVVTPATATVLGKAKPAQGHAVFNLPIHQNYGVEIDTVVSIFGKTLWRTVPEKVRAHIPARVRRHRTQITETGRLVDPEGVLLDNVQQQLLSVAKRVKRTRG